MDLSTFILKSIERNQVLDISQINEPDAFKNIIKTKLEDFMEKKIDKPIKINSNLHPDIITKLQKIVDDQGEYYCNITDQSHQSTADIGNFHQTDIGNSHQSTTDIGNSHQSTADIDNKHCFGLTSSGIFPYIGQEGYILSLSDKPAEFIFPKHVEQMIDKAKNLFEQIKLAFLCEAAMPSIDFQEITDEIKKFEPHYQNDLSQLFYIVAMHYDDLCNTNEVKELHADTLAILDEDLAEMHELHAKKTCSTDCKCIIIDHKNWFEYVKLENNKKVLGNRPCLLGDNIYIPFTLKFLELIGGFVVYIPT